MALKRGDAANFETLRRAFQAGDVALVETTDQTGRYIAVICAVNVDDRGIQMVPLARMFEGNPFEELVDPTEAADRATQPTRPAN